MSSSSAAARATAPARPAPRCRPDLAAVPGTGGTSRLEAVRAPLRATSRVPFLLLCMTILVGALVAVLLLNVAMARGSYEHTDLGREVDQAQQDIQARQSELRAAESDLPRRAAALGMVDAQPPRMIELSTGRVVSGPDGTGQ